MNAASLRAADWSAGTQSASAAAFQRHLVPGQGREERRAKISVDRAALPVVRS